MNLINTKKMPIIDNINKCERVFDSDPSIVSILPNKQIFEKVITQIEKDDKIRDIFKDYLEVICKYKKLSASQKISIFRSEIKNRLVNDIDKIKLFATSDIKYNFLKKLYVTNYKFDIKKIIDSGTVYLVHTAPKLGDLFFKQGDHAVSKEYLLSGDPNNYHFFTRFSIHFYANDMVFPHGHGNWEFMEYAIIVKLDDIKDYLYSVNMDDTVGTYGINYKCKDVYVCLPESDESNCTKLLNWLDSDRIIKYKQCKTTEHERQEIKKKDEAVYSKDTEKCETLRDVVNKSLRNIFLKIKKSHFKRGIVDEYNDEISLISSMILYDNDNMPVCFIPVGDIGNEDKINTRDGDGNLYESNESIITYLQELTAGTLFSLNDNTVCEEFQQKIINIDIEKIDKILIYLVSFYQKNFDNSKDIINNNQILRKILDCIFKKIYNKLNIESEINYNDFFTKITEIYKMGEYPSITMKLYDKKTNFTENYSSVHKEIADWNKKKQEEEDKKYESKYLKYKSKYLLLKKKF